MVRGQWLKPAGQLRLGELVEAKLDGPTLSVRLAPTDEWQPRLLSGRRLLVERLPSLDLWQVFIHYPNPRAEKVPEAATLVLLAVDESPPPTDAAPRLTRVSLTAAGTIIRGVGRFEGNAVRVEYRSSTVDGTCGLTLAFEDGRGTSLSGSGVIELLEQNPIVVRQFLDPVLTELSGNHLLRPRAGDVYRVFTEIDATPEEIARVRQILPALNARDRDVRDAASAALDRLGPPAVLALLRMDRNAFSPEQSVRVDDFLARNSLGRIDPRAARGDLPFLRYAVEDQDKRVRDAARDQMQQLAN